MEEYYDNKYFNDYQKKLGNLEVRRIYLNLKSLLNTIVKF